MNPLALLLLAAATGGGRSSGMAYNGPMKLDTILDQLHGAVNTLEKVNELSRIGNTVSQSIPLPSAAHIPASAQPVEEPDFSVPASAAPAPSLPNIDLQGAMQALGPILSMLGNNQNSR